MACALFDEARFLTLAALRLDALAQYGCADYFTASGYKPECRNLLQVSFAETCR